MSVAILKNVAVRHVRVQYDEGLQGLRDLSRHLNDHHGRDNWYRLDDAKRDAGKVERVVVIGEQV